MEAIREKAREIGRMLSQTDQFRALKRANEQLSEDRETVTLLNDLNRLQDEVTDALRRGQEPSEEQQEQYESLVETLQRRSAYQAVASAQSNFDRLMVAVNEEIAKGIEAGDQSRIILPS